MKKFFSALIFVILCGIFNFCSANSYDDNPDYYFILSVQGWKDYLNLRSIDVQEYNPPYYKISAKIISIGSRQNEGRSREWTTLIKYNWQVKEAFVYENGNWRKMCQGSRGSTPYSVDKLTANAIFRAAYGQNFYD